MPLVGTICCQTGQPETFDHCLQCARAGMCEHPAPVIGAMQNHAGSRKDAGISVSTLLGCPRQHYLAETTDYYEDPERYYARWLGSVNHHAVELGGPYDGITQERRYYKAVDLGDIEITVSGMPDWVDHDNNAIDDFKFVAYPPKMPYPSHETQVNFYGWIIPDFDLERGRIHYFHGPAGPAKKRHTTLAVGTWTDEAVEQWVRRKLSPHAAVARAVRDDPESFGRAVLTLKAEDDFQWSAGCPFRGNGCCCDPQE